MAKDRIVIQFDSKTTAVLENMLFNSYAYTISDKEVNASGHTKQEYKKVHNIFSSKEIGGAALEELPIIIAATKLVIDYMTDDFPDNGGDLLTIVGIRKHEGLRLIALLEDVRSNPEKYNNRLISYEDWGGVID